MTLINKFTSDYKVIFVGDATMGPYEIAYPGGSVEHWNEEPGSAWLNRITNHFDKVACCESRKIGSDNFHHVCNLSKIDIVTPYF